MICPEPKSGVPTRIDRLPLDHQHDRPLFGPGPMKDSSGNRVSLVGQEFDGRSLQIKAELPFQYKEKLILGIVLVPVEFALEDPEPDDTVVDFAQAEIDPFLLVLADELGNIDDDRLAERFCHEDPPFFPTPTIGGIPIPVDPAQWASIYSWSRACQASRSSEGGMVSS